MAKASSERNFKLKGVLSNQPYKGTKDYLPDEYLVQKYIFNTWSKVCQKYGYKEYQTPLLEMAQVYKEKSGEDVGGKELFTLKDLSNRELAIRPEMTPSVTRLVSKIYKEYPKPIRFFNISNFLRNERPQKGRNREFWQLNADIFGDESINSDIEILSLAIELVKAFNPPKNSFKLKLNNRKLIESFLNELDVPKTDTTKILRAMDKYEKFDSEEEYATYCEKVGIPSETAQKLVTFLNTNLQAISKEFPNLTETEGYLELNAIIEALTKLGYSEYIEFNSSVVRGFDYYDGMVFEVFDLNQSNPRSLFGGGRYNGLSDLFGGDNFPAVGFAPGNETFTLFLDNWNLLPDQNVNKDTCYMPLIDGIEYEDALVVANKLRNSDKALNIELDLSEQGITNAIRKAAKTDYSKIIIYGPDEAKSNTVTIKDLNAKEEETININ